MDDMPIGALARMVQSVESSPTSITDNFGTTVLPEYPEGDFPEGWPPTCQWCGGEVLSDSIPFCSDDCAYEATHRPNDAAPAERSRR